ncbi:MAG: ABC transporter ATP-binding protein, partial [Anaerolineales bacterium]|nr:ABC transporter ATP-binding protein [Anaerolineales bacterium]
SNLSKHFYSLTALDNVSLAIPHGEVLGLLGPNGAGKTTLLKIIAGLMQPDGGSLRPRRMGWPVIGYKPERLLFPNQLRVSQYLELIAGISNVSRAHSRQAVGRSLEQVGLLYAANKRIRDCSKGMRQRLALAQVLIGDPPLLLLDEPSNGLDPEGQAEILSVIQALHAAGKTIVLSSHHLHEVTQVCTQLVILNQGRIHYRNSMAEALAVRPHVLIQADRDLLSLRDLLTTLHPDIVVDGERLMLRNEAMALRRPVLAILLQYGYDVRHLEQKRITLAEIYAKAVQSNGYLARP